jgi:hypothetical protein
MTDYEVVLAPAARRALENLDEADAIGLASALQQELANGPNASKEYSFPASDKTYTATPLSFAGYTAIHRPMIREELARLGREQRRRTAESGFYVLDILRAESGYLRRMPSAI